jgi:acetyl-CoA carboxylase biotin carboxyl carrier protein
MGTKFEDIEKVIKLIEKSKEVGEIEWKDIRVSRNVSTASGQPQIVTHTAPAQAAAPAKKKATEAAKPSGHVVKSPMVGTFYLAPSPDADPFIRVGQKVKVGDTLCLIEAMKMFNKIKADKAGKVVDILANDASPVEFDQGLVVIE